MKKLYAKTSFSSKNRSKSGKNENDPNSADSLIKYHDPILAFQPSKCKDVNGDSLQKYKPKHPFGAKIQNLEHLRNPQFSRGENSNVIMPDVSPATYEESPYYYTITELENLQMLDHRHPHFHHHNPQHHLKMQQMHAGGKVYHQHSQLVLQLPSVTSTSTTDDNFACDTIDSPMTSCGQQQQQQQHTKHHYNYANNPQHFHHPAAVSPTPPPRPQTPQNHNDSDATAFPPPPPPLSTTISQMQTATHTFRSNPKLTANAVPRPYPGSPVTTSGTNGGGVRSHPSSPLTPTNNSNYQQQQQQSFETTQLRSTTTNSQQQQQQQQ
uniref:Uncharacterized protein n=1 Tax=Musca domestica TaxID=7370 RepID=T1P9X7_MUSDO